MTTHITTKSDSHLASLCELPLEPVHRRRKPYDLLRQIRYAALSEAIKHYHHAMFA